MRSLIYKTVVFAKDEDSLIEQLEESLKELKRDRKSIGKQRSENLKNSKEIILLESDGYGKRFSSMFSSILYTTVELATTLQKLKSNININK